MRTSLFGLVSACLIGVAASAPLFAQLDPNRGGLHLRVEPQATLYIDGRLVTAVAAEHFAPLAPGVHRLRLVHSDFEDLRRTIDVRAGETIQLTVGLRNQALPRQRAGTKKPVAAAVTNEDLRGAITFYGEGDFAAAGSVLDAVLKDLAGVPRAMRDRAAAAIYYGATLVELARVRDSGVAFALARQLDRTLQPTAAEFSPDVLTAWKGSATVPFTDLPSLSEPATPPPGSPGPPGPTPTPTSVVPAPPSVSAPAAPPPAANPGPAVVLSPAAGGSAPPEPAPTPVDTSSGVAPPAPPHVEDFVVESDATTTLDVVEVTATGTCEGALAFDREAKILAWEGKAASCRQAFRAPFAEIRNPAAAPRGGLLLQFRSDRPSMRVMPRPDGDVVAADAVPMTLAELPASTRVNMRRAQRAMTRALGRPVSDSIFGLQVDVPLEELVANPADYDGSAVRVSGPLGLGPARGQFVIGTQPNVLNLMPGGVTAALLQSNALQWLGKELVVTGTFSRPPAMPGARTPPLHALTVSSAEPASDLALTGDAVTSTIEAITTTPPSSRETVRVVGQFRGLNSYGDLPSTDRRQFSWVIKDGAFAVWVTGRKPEGSGFRLESGNRADMQAWVAVTGSVEEIRGAVYLKADNIELVPAPVAGRVTEVPVGPAASTTPAAIGFVAPVPDIEEATPEQQFVVRFSKPMKEASFEGHVAMRYADAPSAPFPGVSVTYYTDRTHSVMVDPGTVLEAGRTVELVFEAGIEDLYGVPFVTASSGPRVLKWRVAGK